MKININKIILSGLTWKFWLILPLWFAIFAFGVFGLWERLTTGHLLAGYGSYIPWGIWVAMYFYGVGISAGVFIVGVCGYLSGVKGLSGIVFLRRILVLSTAAILPALLGIGLDLGQLSRGSYVMIFTSFSSVLAVNSWLYNIFIATMALAWVMTWLKERKFLNSLLLFGILISFAFSAGSGLFLSAVYVKPAWHSTILPIYTVVSALSAGSAILMLCWSGEEKEAFDFLRRVLIISVILYALFSLVKYWVNHWYPGFADEYGNFASYLPSWSVWFLGCVLPLLFLFLSYLQGWRMAGLLVLLFFFFPRLELLLSGQPPLEMPGLAEAFHDERLLIKYFPTAMEIRVGLLLIGLGLAIYFIGERLNVILLNLFDSGFFSKIPFFGRIFETSSSEKVNN